MNVFAVFLLFLVSPALASLTVTTANQQGSLPFTPSWTPTSANLIAGLSPSNFTGNFSVEGAGASANTLTAGGSIAISQVSGGGGETCSSDYVTCGDGSGACSSIVYALPASANGYNLTNITVYGGWKDGGRDQQSYTVWYATAANPTSFTALTSVNYLPSNPGGAACSTRVTIADSAGGMLLSSVVALKFDFTNPSSENGYCGYAAITVQGTAASPPVGPPVASAPSENPASAATGTTAGTIVTLSASAVGSVPISYQWRTDGGSGGAMTNISGATGANLVVNTTGYALGTYHHDYVAQNSQGTNTSPAATMVIAAMVDIGANAPTPGPNDIAQLLNTSQNDDGINYYTDNGATYGKWCGQTFTTGNNPAGYLLNTLAWKSAGGGQSFGNSQLYDLYFYSLSADGTQATVIASYQCYGGGTENDWFQWLGLNVPLAPNQVYAYAFGRDTSAGGYEHIGDLGGNSYSGGQIMTVPNTTGTGPVTYGMSGKADAVFDLGLTLYNQPAPRALMPALVSGVYPIYAGTTNSVTLKEVALGTAPLTYQWLCDHGAGGTSSPVDGATNSNLVINLNGPAAGNYNYAVAVSNALGSSSSPSFNLNILGPTAPSVASDITPAPVNTGNVGDTVQYTAAFTGTPPISYQWMFNNGYGPTPISTSGNHSARSNTLTLSNLQWTNDGVYSVVAQNYGGSVTSSVSTLVVMPPTTSLSPVVTMPPVSLQISKNSSTVHLQWAQGTLQQTSNPYNSWTSIATNLETTNYAVLATNLAAYFRSIIARQPRIVNIYCFCRDQDYRFANSQQMLFNCTTQQVQLFKQANLPATFALQHDTLMDTNYQNYFKTQLTTNDEIGAWWEITQSLCQRAGVMWRGSHEWEPTANIDFSCGYTPTERKQLVDAYMSDFNSVFGYYPKTVGSWYVDEVTLQYMQQQYGVVASANCKDQIGTDTYTMWGSYWNQAYYPSKVNAYMPAQTPAGQIDVPVFRLLGSDPIYQYGNFTPGIYTLEPVYPYSGGSRTWVGWYFNALIKQPSLAFGYTQAGQENSFGWTPRLTDQVALIAAEAHAGEVQVMTMARAGEWFRKNFSVTPPTSVVALDDPKQQGRKSVWYDSRFYRLNLLWDQGTFYVRDLHRFDENVVSPTYSNTLATTYFNYQTLPVMDGGQWSGSGTNAVGMWPVLISSNGATSFMIPDGAPVVKELNPTDLSIRQPLSGGGTFSIICCESNITCIALDGQGRSLQWAWNLVGGIKQSSVVQDVTSNTVTYNYLGANYKIQMPAGAGSCQQSGDGSLQFRPDASGKLVMDLGQ